MADFFNVSTDRNLLHSSIRDNDELSTIIDQVERQIISYYKQRPSVPIRIESGRENLETTPNAIEVMLTGYDEDTPSDSTDELQDALKYTIADVASWVLRNYNIQQGAHSIQQGQRSITYGISVPHWREWPDGWTTKNGLHLFDEREALYSI